MSENNRLGEPEFRLLCTPEVAVLGLLTRKPSWVCPQYAPAWKHALRQSAHLIRTGQPVFLSFGALLSGGLIWVES